MSMSKTASLVILFVAVFVSLLIFMGNLFTIQLSHLGAIEKLDIIKRKEECYVYDVHHFKYDVILVTIRSFDNFFIYSLLRESRILILGLK